MPYVVPSESEEAGKSVTTPQQTLLRDIFLYVLKNAIMLMMAMRSDMISVIFMRLNRGHLWHTNQ